MSIINRSILSTIVQIIAVILILLISIPVWKTFENNEYADMAEYYSNNYSSIQFEKISLNNNVNLLNYSDNKKYNSNDIFAIRNNTGYNVTYKLYLKTNIIDDSNIYISINNKKYQLSELNKTSNGDNNYYLLDEMLLNNKFGKKYEINIWLGNNSVAYEYLKYDYTYDEVKSERN